MRFKKCPLCKGKLKKVINGIYSYRYICVSCNKVPKKSHFEHIKCDLDFEETYIMDVAGFKVFSYVNPASGSIIWSHDLSKIVLKTKFMIFPDIEDKLLSRIKKILILA